jgi:hypothetical protein
MQITGAFGNLRSDGAMDGDFCSFDVRQDALIGCRFPALIVLGLQAVHRCG